ncbi:cell growth-regulating nucleolar protein [Neodiprion pinetum]|uniref:Cell growth-regulating nucleolar protein n=1 Tax=Neodiprion lecontei TaxID=441921 RepID=A0A6J0C4E0_NEOLC|nr:cell growth-regulating nucleolar protein [Neodiprion lecontei]XP_046489144.1 cell growth-regulating nucleolar protein [Neodiprion pinetum]
MVFFTCTHCGEAIKKPKVGKHFQFKCRNSISVSCMDCFQDFRGQEFVKHTKCITEAQRYGGKDFVLRPSKNKGEQKQQDWVAVVHAVIENSENLSAAERNILNTLSNHDNVPRKKAKFFNFMKSMLAGRVNLTVLESIWTKMEEAFKKTLVNKAPTNTNVCSVAQDNVVTPLIQTDISENENNENLSNEYKTADPNAEYSGNSENQSCEISLQTTDNSSSNKSKKSLKRKIPEEMQYQKKENVHSDNRNCENFEQNLCSIGMEENCVGSKKSKKLIGDELESTNLTTAMSQNNSKNISYNNEMVVKKFNWSDAILEVLYSKKEVSLRKLRKKVLRQYQIYSKVTVLKGNAAAKFDRKINRMTQIVIEDGKVKLTK